jgi:competence protein ComGC
MTSFEKSRLSRKLPAMRQCAGFTLLEVCLAVLIAVLIVTMAVPSVGGLLADRRVRKSFDVMDDLVREAQQRSVDERRAFVLEWEKDRVVLRPLEPESAEEERGLKEIATVENDSYALELPAALVKEPEAAWTFWPTGTCEPAIIYHEGEAGKWLARYDPLTVRAVLEQ